MARSAVSFGRIATSEQLQREYTVTHTHTHSFNKGILEKKRPKTEASHFSSPSRGEHFLHVASSAAITARLTASCAKCMCIMGEQLQTAFRVNKRNLVHKCKYFGIGTFL